MPVVATIIRRPLHASRNRSQLPHHKGLITRTQPLDCQLVRAPIPQLKLVGVSALEVVNLSSSKVAEVR